jgi:NAD(P)-dependent dehydrogenase (short-subunit alcohol dehydrogenase family)
MTAKLFELKGKTALVAGDSKFWTKSVVAALAGAGADVAVAARNSPKLTEAVEIARKAGRKAIAIPTDITNPAQVQRAVQHAHGEYGHLDILVNATDVPFFQPFLGINAADWQKTMDCNLNSVANFIRAAAKPMLEQKKGRIINIISGLAERGICNGAAYCVSMGGVLELTRVLALEWATQGITVNAIGTGWFSEDGKARDESIAKYIPAKRYGKPEDLGSLVVYLASDATEFTTGQWMFVDGGLMAHA